MFYCCCCLATKTCLTLRDPMDCSTPGFPVLHCLLEFVQTHVHWVGMAVASNHRVFFNWSTQELFSHVAEHIFTYLFLTILDYSWVLTSLLNKSLDLVNHMLIYNFFGLSSISTIFVPIVKITPIVMALLSCRILTSFVAQLTLTFFFQMSVQTWFFKYLWTSSTILLILIN